MRLRRLEFVFISVTLAFMCFMGGYFTGRSLSPVNKVSVSTQNDQPPVNVSDSLSRETQSERSGSGYQINDSGADTSANQETGQQSPIQLPVNPEPGASSDIAGAPRGGDGKININLASQSELTDLPGIGSVLASRIIDHRRQHGDFLRIEDIRNVSGIGEKRYEAIEDKITVG